MILHRHIVVFSLSALGVASCASGSTPRDMTRAPGTSSTAYRAGDFVTYFYEGAGLPGDSVMLHERIVEQQENVLHIEVAARRGAEERRWIQVVTDTPENQQSNKIDALFIVSADGTRETLDATDSKVVHGLYSWTLPPHIDPAGEPMQRQVTARLGAVASRCTQTKVPVVVGDQKAAFITTSCPEFLWTHGPALLVDSAGEVLWKVSVLASGDAAAASETHVVD